MSHYCAGRDLAPPPERKSDMNHASETHCSDRHSFGASMRAVFRSAQGSKPLIHLAVTLCRDADGGVCRKRARAAIAPQTAPIALGFDKEAQ